MATQYEPGLVDRILDLEVKKETVGGRRGLTECTGSVALAFDKILSTHESNGVALTRNDTLLILRLFHISDVYLSRDILPGPLWKIMAAKGWLDVAQERKLRRLHRSTLSPGDLISMRNQFTKRRERILKLVRTGKLLAKLERAGLSPIWTYTYSHSSIPAATIDVRRMYFEIEDAALKVRMEMSRANEIILKKNLPTPVASILDALTSQKNLLELGARILRLAGGTSERESSTLLDISRDEGGNCRGFAHSGDKNYSQSDYTGDRRIGQISDVSKAPEATARLSEVGTAQHIPRKRAAQEEPVFFKRCRY